jgi:pimeloyl-ACP methyl ester carboxylesterase
MEATSFTHGMAQIAPGVRIHYLESGAGARTAVLLHGFPQTAHEWRKLTPLLVRGGLRVVALDYRGAGDSSRPASGYDKRTLASDTRALIREHLRIEDPIVLVGHDVGGIAAVAYALDYRDEVTQLVVIDTPIPGTRVFEGMRGDPRGWHAAFHSARDIAELLVHGRERAYLRHMIEVRIFDPSAIAPEDFDVYVRAYEAPGAMRAGFELYRAFDGDGAMIQDALRKGGKLKIPVLAVGGASSGLGSIMKEMISELAEQVESVIAPRSAHWIPEENPQFLADAILQRTRTHA